MEPSMRFSPEQHLKVAFLLEGKSETNPDPVKATKQSRMAKAFRLLAQKASEKEGHSVPHQTLRPMVDEPGAFDPVAAWERFLTETEALPDSVQKAQTILHAELMIALKKEELAPMPSNLPLMVAMIDEPGPFGNNLSEWQQFLAEMEQLPDSVQKRQSVNNAKQMIAMKMWEYGPRR
jgi:hypothetical protein